MTEPLHVGFSGTRHGMTSDQWVAVHRVLREVTESRKFFAHHGDCIGADAQFSEICNSMLGLATMVVHPGPPSRFSAGCRASIRLNPKPNLERNQDIVDASHVMIVAPLERWPQPRGGTWWTFRAALRALRAGKLTGLHVIGRDGQPFDHGNWKLP